MEEVTVFPFPSHIECMDPSMEGHQSTLVGSVVAPCFLPLGLQYDRALVIKSYESFMVCDLCIYLCWLLVVLDFKDLYAMGPYF